MNEPLDGFEKLKLNESKDLATTGEVKAMGITNFPTKMTKMSKFSKMSKMSKFSKMSKLSKLSKLSKRSKLGKIGHIFGRLFKPGNRRKKRLQGNTTTYLNASQDDF